MSTETAQNQQVYVDWENNAETFWTALRAIDLATANLSPEAREAIESLRGISVDNVTVDGATCEKMFAFFKGIPGFADGPSYAPTAIRHHDAADQCECGEVDNLPCAHELDDEAVLVEWMPEWRRDSHEAAGGSGSWPHNGARRLRCAPGCAHAIVAADPEWASVVAADAD